jgi:aldo/keto reductase family protein
MHSQLIEVDYQLFKHNEVRTRNCTTLSCYFDGIIPAFERLKQEGKIVNWAIGGIAYVSESVNPSRILNECQENEVPILAIRVVQAGALTSAMDREPHPSGFDAEDFVDFDRAAPFRQIASEWCESPVSLAHRYALQMKILDNLFS